MDENKYPMQWAIIAVASFVLLATCLTALFKEDVDTTGAFYLFGSVASLVLGGAIINRIKK